MGYMNSKEIEIVNLLTDLLTELELCYAKLTCHRAFKGSEAETLKNLKDRYNEIMGEGDEIQSS